MINTMDKFNKLEDFEPKEQGFTLNTLDGPYEGFTLLHYSVIYDQTSSTSYLPSIKM